MPITTDLSRWPRLARVHPRIFGEIERPGPAGPAVRAVIERVCGFGTRVLLLSMLVSTAPIGCAGDPGLAPAPTAAARRAAVGDAGPSARPASADAPIPATWRRPEDGLGAGDPIREAELRAHLVELAGAVALEELALDRALADRWRREGRGAPPSATDSIVIAERDALLATLDRDADRAMRLLEEIRRRDGLGPVRFDALLRRNAMLRAFVAPSVTVDQPAVEAAFDAAHGPRRVARVIVLPDRRDAALARADLDRGVPFEEVAVERSIDGSASTGGLIDPVARLDPSWPPALREALWSLAPGATSAPIVIDTNVLLVRFERELPADGTRLSTVRREIETSVRRSRERLRMDELARRLLAESDVAIQDTALRGAIDRARSPLTRSR